ncbi:hypothetical protein [Methylotenera sp.]|uniref:hypothetical protein n=1 Tax=Methylotenera sp. TaxID=2051956 RepID=UPI002ED85C6B
MSAWKINTLMNQHFPESDFSKLALVNIEGKPEVLEAILKLSINSEELLISVNRKVGARLSLKDAVNFIQFSMGKAEMRVSNREFTQFVIAAPNCTAVGLN